MDEKLKRDIEHLLRGNVSPEEAQRYLTRISDGDIERHIPGEDLDAMLRAYRQRNDFHHEPVPGCSESEKEALWQRIRMASAKGSKKNKPTGSLTSRVRQFFYMGHQGRRQLALALVSILILVTVPSVIYHYNNPEKPFYTGMKGNHEAFGSIHYAILDSANTLSRPDRPLTESDTLAFRLTVKQSGYFSLYIIGPHSTDVLFADTYFDEGVHDLDLVYHLTDNAGENSLALASGSAPVHQEGMDLRPLIREAERNHMPLLDIDRTTLNLSYRTLMVRKQPQ